MIWTRFEGAHCAHCKANYKYQLLINLNYQILWQQHGGHGSQHGGAPGQCHQSGGGSTWTLLDQWQPRLQHQVKQENILVSFKTISFLRLWNLESKTCVQEITAHRKKFDESIFDVAFHPTRPYIASAGNIQINIWNHSFIVFTLFQEPTPSPKSLFNHETSENCVLESTSLKIIILFYFK